jgi:hypothetical protein
MSVAPPPTGLERLFRVEVLVGPIEDHGMTSAGHRRVVSIVGGRIFDGVHAEVLPGGADWQVVRPDGTIEIDTRYTARTADGALLHLRTHGIRAGSPAVLEALLHGADVPATEYSFRLHVTVETSAPAYDSLQRELIVAAAARGEGLVVYDAYRMT